MNEEHGSQEKKREPMIEMSRAHYAPYRWVQSATAIVALWLISSPFTLKYASTALAISDIATGVVSLVLSLIALSPRRGWASWAQAIPGLWLLLAPLIFWAPNAATYLNDTFAGMALIAFAFLIPMGMEMEGPDVPPGWSYNPSAWPQRAPAIALAVISFFIARYMAAYQLGYIDSVWDPFFGKQTQQILDSDVSRMWPVSDAGLGAAMYMIEALSGFMGDKRRWRTMPWMVAVFGFAVVPLGIVSIVLVIMQPLAVDAWCSPCLLTAALMLAMIPISIDEIVAMVQFIRLKKREGVPAWRTFWLGGELAQQAPSKVQIRKESWSARGMLFGVTPSWPLFGSIALGLWLMFAPAVLRTSGASADSDHLIGPLIIVVAAIALAEVARPVRFLNVILGLWLATASWFLEGGNMLSHLSSAAGGLLIIALSLPLGTIRDHYAAFDRIVRLGRRASAH